MLLACFTAQPYQYTTVGQSCVWQQKNAGARLSIAKARKWTSQQNMQPTCVSFIASNPRGINMSGSTDFSQWNPGAVNQESDSSYQSDVQRTGGAQTGGVFPSLTANKV